MRTKKECIAMLLAGGQGSRLGVLTKKVAKPAIPFGGKYRIIDFTLSNCINSGIDTVGVLTQYQPLELNAYIGNGGPWDLDRNQGGVSILPPYMTGKSGKWYNGTADAIFQNMPFIEQFDPEYVVILSGDHIYKMDYSLMLRYHKQKGAGCTIAVRNVPIEEASRFGIMNTDSDNRINEFEEKPAHPKSTKASMGVYIFNWQLLKQYMIADEANPESSNDFGKNIIPSMLNAGERMFAYEFDDYWKDVGTLSSLWEANMELLGSHPPMKLSDPSWRIYARAVNEAPHYISAEAKVSDSMIAEGARIYGTVEHSIISSGVYVGAGSVIRDSIVLPFSRIEEGVTVEHAIIGQNAVISYGARVGEPKEASHEGFTPNSMCGYLAVVGDELRVAEGAAVNPGEILETNRE